MPEGYFTVSTELSSNFTPLSTRRPSSAREEYRRRRDTLRTEGNVSREISYKTLMIFVEVSYQVEGKSAYIPRSQNIQTKYIQTCGDCREQKSDSIQVSTILKLIIKHIK